MPDISEVVQRVAAQIPAAPDPVIEDIVKMTYLDFCQETRVLRRRTDSLTVGAGTEFVTLDNLSCGELVVSEIITLSVNGKQIEAADYERALQKNAVGRPGVPRYFDRVPGRQIRLYPTTDREITLDGECYMEPGELVYEIDDFLYRRFGQGFRHGVIYNLTSMKNKPWTDDRQSAESFQFYQVALKKAEDYGKQNDQHKARVTRYGGY